MNHVTPTTVVVGAYGTIMQPGTVTGTGIDWSPTYERDVSMFASCGAVSAGGTLVAHLQGSNVLGSGYVSLGSVTFNDAAGGTTIQTVDVDRTAATYRYYRSLMTCVGGTVTGGAAAGFIGRPYTTS